MIDLTYRRPDGSFVAIVSGLPYHVEPSDVLFAEASELADELGDDLPFEPDPEPAVFVVTAISDRQFAQQLAVLGTITEAEALAWAARGDLPSAMETAIAALPEGERFGARMLLSSATTYERAHPLVPVLGALLGYDANDIDDLWSAAALL